MYSKPNVKPPLSRLLPHDEVQEASKDCDQQKIVAGKGKRTKGIDMRVCRQTDNSLSFPTEKAAVWLLFFASEVTTLPPLHSLLFILFERK